MCVLQVVWLHTIVASVCMEIKCVLTISQLECLWNTDTVTRQLEARSCMEQRWVKNEIVLTAYMTGMRRGEEHQLMIDL